MGRVVYIICKHHGILHEGLEHPGILGGLEGSPVNVVHVELSAVGDFRHRSWNVWPMARGSTAYMGRETEI
jgi:hypothetical protein